MTRRTSAIAALVTILMPGLSGCGAVGPESMQANRVDDNMTIQGANDQE